MTLSRFYLICVITTVLLFSSCVTAPVKRDTYNFSQYKDCAFILEEEDSRTIIDEGVIESIHLMVKFRLICPRAAWTGSSIEM
jgi:hypothetical protein